MTMSRKRDHKHCLNQNIPLQNHLEVSICCKFFDQISTLSSKIHCFFSLFLLGHNLAPLLASALVPMLPCANYYVTFVWMAVYMETILDPPIQGAFWINACASFFGHSIPSVYTVSKLKLCVGFCFVLSHDMIILRFYVGALIILFWIPLTYTLGLSQ